MRRRQFIGLASIVAGLPLAARAQQAVKVRRIGFLARSSADSLAPLLESFKRGLRDLGWIEGGNVSIEYHFGDGLNRLAELANALVRSNADIIVTIDTPPTQAAKLATSTIPIVIAVSADPVGAGLVASLAQPGGNVTGMSLLAPDTDEKNIGIVKEALPKARRMAMITDPNNRGMTLRLAAVQTAASRLGLEFQSLPAPGPDELAGALRAAAEHPPDALIVLSPIYAAHRKAITDFEARTSVPLIFDTKGLAAEPGALLSYGADLSALFLRSAAFVDKILKGARPADLPIEQPTKFELVINLKTAKALGLEIPPTVLAQADEVIE